MCLQRKLYFLLRCFNWYQFNSLNLTSKDVKSNVIQHLNQCSPGHWLLPLLINPLPEYLDVDLLRISLVLVFYVADSSFSSVLQEEETKVVVIGANLLGNVDAPLPPWEPDAFYYSWVICNDNTKHIASKHSTGTSFNYCCTMQVYPMLGQPRQKSHNLGKYVPVFYVMYASEKKNFRPITQLIPSPTTVCNHNYFSGIHVIQLFLTWRCWHTLVLVSDWPGFFSFCYNSERRVLLKWPLLCKTHIPISFNIIFVTLKTPTYWKECRLLPTFLPGALVRAHCGGYQGTLWTWM